jgi:hypothetical protein
MCYTDFMKAIFEVREVAELLATNPRRVEGWAEKGYIRPAIQGHGPGRRRAFDLVNVLQAALLLDLGHVFGERSPAAGRIVQRAAAQVQKAGRELLDDPDRALAILAGQDAYILLAELDSDTAATQIMRFGEHHGFIAEALRRGRTVVVVNLTDLGARVRRQMEAANGPQQK